MEFNLKEKLVPGIDHYSNSDVEVFSKKQDKWMKAKVKMEIRPNYCSSVWQTPLSVMVELGVGKRVTLHWNRIV